MSPHRSRFVTATQQVLALAVVLVALAPATHVVSLDVVAVRPRAEPQVALSGLVGHPLRGRDLLAPAW